jgi:hypothetical protein
MCSNCLPLTRSSASRRLSKSLNVPTHADARGQRRRTESDLPREGVGPITTATASATACGTFASPDPFSKYIADWATRAGTRVVKSQPPLTRQVSRCHRCRVPYYTLVSTFSVFIAS